MKKVVGATYHQRLSKSRNQIAYITEVYFLQNWGI